MGKQIIEKTIVKSKDGKITETIVTTPIKARKASKVLGILSICLFITTWPGMVLGIIGMSLKKDEEHATRDWALNIIGVALSLIWLIYVMSLPSTFMY